MSLSLRLMILTLAISPALAFGLSDFDDSSVVVYSDDSAVASMVTFTEGYTSDRVQESSLLPEPAANQVGSSLRRLPASYEAAPTAK